MEIKPGKEDILGRGGVPDESPPQLSGHGSSTEPERRVKRGLGADFPRWGKSASFGGTPPLYCLKKKQTSIIIEKYRGR